LYLEKGIPAYVIGDATLFERDNVNDLYNLFLFHFRGATKPWMDASRL
jgi:hypothetical protein